MASMHENGGSGSQLSADKTGSARRPGKYAWYVLLVLMLVYVLNFIDRQILSILAEEIKHDLKLNDADLGFLYGTAFAIFYAVFGIPFGRLADRWHRGKLLAIGLTVWSAMTALSGFASTYGQLAAARVGVGVGEASASPAAFALLANHFPARQRALALSIYSAGVYIGMGCSLAIGGVVSSAWNTHYAGGGPLGLVGWQVSFLVVGLPGLLLAALVLTLREPKAAASGPIHVAKSGRDAWRSFAVDVATVLPPLTLFTASRVPGGLRANLAGMTVIAVLVANLSWLSGDWAQWITYGAGTYAIFSWALSLRHSDPGAFALIWGHRAIPLALLGFGSLALVTYSFGFWAAPFAIRTFGLSAATVGSVIGLPGALASAAGVIAGGKLSDVWKVRDPRGRIFTCMAAAALPAPFMIMMFLSPDFGRYATLSPIVFFLVNLWAGSAVATYQDLVLPRMNGTIGAVYLLGSTMIGLALGPYLIGKIAAVSGSLVYGALALVLAAPVALLALWLLSRCIVNAEASKNERAAAAAG